MRAIGQRNQNTNDGFSLLYSGIPLCVSELLTHDTEQFQPHDRFSKPIRFSGRVPRLHSTGGKAVYLGISKRGNRYIRTQLVYGARDVVKNCKDKTDRS